MGATLRVLIVEDSPTDALLFVRELERGGYAVLHRRVDTAAAMEVALAESSWDLVLADFSTTRFDVPSALQGLKASGLEVPCIVMSGTVGEEAAVEALKLGADDFVAKGNLARLVPAIERELREVDARAMRRDAEEKLRESDLRLRTVTETATDAIVSFDEAGRVVYANPAAERTFGRAAADFAGLPFRELIAPSSPPGDVARLSDVIVGHGDPVVRSLELAGRRGDGTEFPVELSCARWNAAGGGGATAIVRDTTERKKLEAQLMISDRLLAIGSLTAGVAHEINNPLASLLANLELAGNETRELGRWLGAPAQLRELETLLDAAREAGDRLRHIVRDLRIFSRAEEETVGPVDVRQVLESTSRLAWNEIRHRARLTTDFREAPPVLGNEFRLGQVFLNLIVNAAQAIPEGDAERHEIALATRSDAQGRIVVEVSDSGSGMAPEVVRRLFTPFFTTKPRGVGTGLGLSICRRIVEGFGGVIAVESAPGKGSTFRVTLPAAKLAPAGTSASAAGAAVAPSPAPRRGRVLVVDDESSILNVVRLALGKEHDVTTCSDATDALERIVRGEPYDVVLCDMMMPRKTGMELHADLVRVAPAQAERMIFLTGGAFTPRARAFLEEVRNLRVEKPFRLADLRAIVNRQLA